VKHPVVWTEAAVLDLEQIVGFVAERSPASASRLLRKIETSARSLENASSRGRVVPEFALFGIEEWRELILAPYRLIYRVSGKQIAILALLDARRDLQDLLLERLVRST
jgi:toxin ParE1/3/4